MGQRQPRGRDEGCCRFREVARAVVVAARCLGGGAALPTEGPCCAIVRRCASRWCSRSPN
ncbi:hypothetical protein Pyn_22156 [Prunus yedoensis var. nudiflora]|uniref:Uncharacterized protein n=1 Tax=Prunus yedoensis var. nudiflora TaxID=2094558 RepID=A0A314U892_PRUYE|nr:hypothetical protein Pyn_22156 [Prunus yedoensis var. nudiflora]